MTVDFTDAFGDERSISGDYKTMALYGVYRSEGQAYFKTKLGLLREEIKFSFDTETDSGLSAGIGVGVRLGQFNIEAEATILESDANYFSIGAYVNF